MRHVTIVGAIAGLLVACSNGGTTDAGPDTFVPGDSGATFDTFEPIDSSPIDASGGACGDASCNAGQICQQRFFCSSDPLHPMEIPTAPVCVDVPSGCHTVCDCPGLFCPSNGNTTPSAHCLPDGGVQCGPAC